MKTRIALMLLVKLALVNVVLCGEDEDAYALRRRKVMEAMNGGAALLTSRTASDRTNKNFYYLTGIRSADTTLLLIPEGRVQEVLFTTDGAWPYASGKEWARVHDHSETGRNLNRYLRGKEKLFTSFDHFALLAEHNRPFSRMSTIVNIDPLIGELRIIKDDLEIEALKTACRITAESLSEVFKIIQPGLREIDLAEFLENAFLSRGSEGKSFLQAASGPNATHVHFGASERTLEDGDLIVFDAGAYWKGYTSDISRTVPVSGRFTEAQREIYRVVLEAQKAGIELMVPGGRLLDAQEAAEDALIEGLHGLGLVPDKDSEWQRTIYIQHGFGHFIGLDVHDVWYAYARDLSDKIYEPGMVMTFEPGLYFPEKARDFMIRRTRGMVDDAALTAFIEQVQPVYEKYANIGVRIEDDVLITEDGHLLLTDGVPKEISRIEEMMEER